MGVGLGLGLGSELGLRLVGIYYYYYYYYYYYCYYYYYYLLLLYLGVLQLVEQDVRRLNVAVQHRVAVQVGDPLRGLVREPPGWG